MCALHCPKKTINGINMCNNFLTQIGLAFKNAIRSYFGYGYVNKKLYFASFYCTVNSLNLIEALSHVNIFARP